MLTDTTEAHTGKNTAAEYAKAADSRLKTAQISILHLNLFCVTGYPWTAFLQPSFHHRCPSAVLAGSDLSHVRGRAEDRNALWPFAVEVGLPAGMSLPAITLTSSRGVGLTWTRHSCSNWNLLHSIIAKVQTWSEMEMNILRIKYFLYAHVLLSYKIVGNDQKARRSCLMTPPAFVRIACKWYSSISLF